MPITQRLVAINVQYGVPEDGELVFNVHMTNNSTGVTWDVSYRFSQLATLDHDISMSCDKMKEIPFPQIDDALMEKLTRRANYSGKLKDLNRFRSLMEDWIQYLIARCHLMPYILYELVEDWFCLPLGPTTDWTPGRALSSNEQSALQEIINNLNVAQAHQGNSGPVGPSNTSGNKRPGMIKSISTLLTGSHMPPETQHDTKNDKKTGFHNSNLPESNVVLLKVRVQRGQRGRNGRIEYDIHIEHSPRTKPFTVSRSYSVFRRLYDIIRRVHVDNLSKSGKGGGVSTSQKPIHDKGIVSVKFPDPPFRSNLGLALTEANLSYRTRQLDAWMRDVCCCYRYMQEMERAAVRYFLDLDMSRNVDISIQDRLARGLVEAPRANVYVPAMIREKEPNEISEIASDIDATTRKSSTIRLKSNVSDTGLTKKSSMWETSSLASSTLRSATNSSNIGRGNLFQAKIQNSGLTADKLNSLQNHLQSQHLTSKLLPGQIKNQYNITNSNSMEEKKNRLTIIDEDGGGGNDAGSVDSESNSIVGDRDLDEDALLRIGMDDKPVSARNKAATDQWVAREFNNNGRGCIIS